MPLVWYCCCCQFGPLNVEIDAACASCSVPRCAHCPVQMTKYTRYAEGAFPFPRVPITNKPPMANDEYALALSTSNGGMSLSSPPSPSISRRLDRTSSAGCQDAYHVHEVSANVLRIPHARHTSGITSKPADLYICCQCQDGPKVYQNQPVCVNCNHVVCAYCYPAN